MTTRLNESPLYFHSKVEMDARAKAGTQFLEMVWYFTADRIVKTAVEVYQLNKEQEKALKTVYLRPGDYTIRLLKPDYQK